MDLSPVNTFIVPYQFLMPVIKHELGETAKKTKFAGVDFMHSYWQLLLAMASRVCQSSITLDCILTLTRVLHGTTNAALHLQSFLTTKLPPELLAQALLCVQDCLFHEESIKALLQNLLQFSEFCAACNLKLNPCKCNIYMKEARWCGRIISAAGIFHDPSKLDGLTNMTCPTSGGQLQIFRCAMQWLRLVISNFHLLMKDVHKLLEHVYAKNGKRTKRAVARASLSIVGWKSTDTASFEAVKKSIIHRITISHHDEAKCLCLYTDDSHFHWSGIVTQVSQDQHSSLHIGKDNEVMAFHSGRLSKTQLGWTKLEEEVFDVMVCI